MKTQPKHQVWIITLGSLGLLALAWSTKLKPWLKWVLTLVAFGFLLSHMTEILSQVRKLAKGA